MLRSPRCRAWKQERNGLEVEKNLVCSRRRKEASRATIESTVGVKPKSFGAGPLGPPGLVEEFVFPVSWEAFEGSRQRKGVVRRRR